MASSSELPIQSGRGCRNLVRSSFVVLAGCGMIFPTSLQSRKGGDMACVRGPLEGLLSASDANSAPWRAME
jgi:hypothetical protein